MDAKKNKIQDVYVMSPMQEGMYYNNVIDSNSNAYFEQMQLNFKGNINVPMLQEAMNLLLKKYAVLRSNFINKQAKVPVQIVWTARNAEVAYYNFSMYSDIENEIEKFKLADREKGFNLANDILIRLSVIQTSEDDFSIVLSYHHIIMDGWSKAIILKELFEYYEMLRAGEPIQVEKEASYKEYINWVQKQNKKYAKDFYKEYLDEYEKTEGLFGLTNKNNERKQYKNRNYIFDIPETICNGLYAISKKHNVTINSILQTVWGILVQKYTNSNDVVFGVVTSGRPSVINRVEEMVGVFINTVPVRVQCDAEKDKFIDLVKKVQMNFLMMQDKGYLTLADIQSCTQVKEDLIDHLFTFENYSVSDDRMRSKFQSEDFELLSTNSFEETNYDFNILFVPQENNRMKCCFNYNENKIPEIKLKYLKQHIMTLIENVIVAPEATKSQLSVICEEERKQIFDNFNACDVKKLREYTIKEFFEQGVKKYSNKTAIEFGQKILSYKELNNVANKIAHYLLEEGVKPNQFVAIASDRSLETVIAILGIVKAGAAYVPIDLDNPEERISYIIGDCKPVALLTTRGITRDDVKMVSITSIISDNTISEADVTAENNWMDTLYMIYTSGTTGMPKGVMVNNRSLQNYILFCTQTYVKKDIVMPLFTNLCFDLTVTSLFYPLLNGGKIVVYNDDIDVMIRMIFHNKEFSVIKLTPGHLNIANDLSNTEELPVLESLILGGEELETKTVADTLDKYGEHIKIYNEYGPTETTVGCSIYECSGDRDSNVRTMPIGVPIVNTQIVIMNENEMLGIGMWGELCITGECVTKGYLNKDEMNREKFVENPFGQGKIYRTGDLAKWGEDGILIYGGRFDEQVKLRGYRIELGEITGVVKEYDTVTDAITIVKSDQNNNKYLCTYFVSENEIDMNELKSYVSKKVPFYMVPNYMIRIEKIPLTKNGKTDKRLLPEIEIQYKEKYVAPKNELQKVLCKLFEEVLLVAQVGVEDNFFELGGHSLKLIRLINRIETELQVKVPIKQVFDNPTPKKLEKVLKQLSVVNEEPIPKAEEKEYYPVSFSQQRIYFASSMDNVGIAYNMPAFLEVNGVIDIEKMQSAVDWFVDQNEIIRTSFFMVEGKIVQQVHHDVQVKIEFKDLTDSQQETEYDIMKSFVKKFALDQAPLMRIKILKFGNLRYFICVDIHHIISDGISNQLMIKQILGYYNEQIVHKEESELQYKDYASWIVNHDFSKERKFWNKAIKNEELTFEFPLDHERTQVHDNSAERVTSEISAEVRDKIKVLCQKYNITEYMFMTAAWMILLSKYSKQENVVIGTAVSGREREEISNMMGIFINTVVLCGKPEKRKSFVKFIQEIQKNILQVIDNQTYPFELLIDDMKIERTSNRNPIFDIMFMFQDDDQDIENNSLNLNNAKVKYISDGQRYTKFDMTIDVKCNVDSYLIGIEYCKSLFDKSTIVQMIKHFTVLLHDIVKKPWEKIGQLNMISDKEKNFLVHDFNKTIVTYNEEATIVELFEAAVLRWGDNPAVVFNDEVITYSELDRKASIVAARLQDEGVQKGDFVVLMAERSIEMMIGIYGVIKSGATYVPVDVNYPEQRIQYILEDCKPRAVLTYHAQINTEVKIIDMETVDFLNDSCEMNKVSICPSDIFYLIYTSGTSGNPKGVMIPNRSIVNYCNANQYNIMGGAVDCSLKKIVSVTNMVFDIFNTEAVMSLVNGMTVYVADSYQQESGKELKELIDKNGIEIIQTTPSRINMLLDECNFMSGLKLILVGGEKLSKELANKIRSCTDAKLVNIYGPSETTIWSTMQVVDKEYENVPIGRPIANTTVYVLEDGKISGIGIAGELCIGGKGLSSGYLNRPELTEEKFVNHAELGEKIYHTGDLAKISTEGELLFLGRIDEQVKVRGHRIELGEIESTIRKTGMVKDAIVITRNNEQDENELYAYVTASGSVEFDLLEQEISKYLPNYMLPGYYMQITKIPINKNGKLDKKKLPVNCMKRQSHYVMPKTDTERMICSLFSSVLKVEKVGMLDDFFKMGGHSLNAVKLANEIEKRTGIRLTLRFMFKNTTPKLIAEYIEEKKQITYEEIPVAESREYYDMSVPQRSIFMASEAIVNSVAYNMPFYLEFQEKVDIDKLQNAFNQLISRHDSLRTSFRNIGEKLVQKIDKNVSSVIEILNHDEYDETMLSQLVEPFQLDKAPLMRIKLVKIRGREIVFIDMHHIIADGISIEIIKNELFALYKGEKLDDSKVQYKDFSEWLRRKDISSQKSFWMEQLQNVNEPLELPYDHSGRKEEESICAQVTAVIEDSICEKIKELAVRARCTEYAVMLSSLMIALSKYSHQEEILIGSPVSGRIHTELENVVGMFVNTLVLKGYPSKEKVYRDFLQEIKEFCLTAFENQECYFEELVHDLDSNLSRGRMPLINTVFTMQDANAYKTSEYHELNIHRERNAKFDLIFQVASIEEKYEVRIEYNKKLFEEKSIHYMLQHYIEVLHQIVMNEYKTIEQIEMITESEKQLILNEFNNTATQYPRDKSMAELFDEQVKKYADETAIYFKNKEITYKELDEKSNCIVRMLHNCQIQKGDCVTIFAEKQIEVIIAIVGIIKCGATYVPVDPRYPDERIQYIINNSKSKVLLTYKKNVQVEINTIDLGVQKNWEVSGSEIIPYVETEMPAYIMHTSGTTGKPKGVIITQKSIIRLVKNTNFCRFDHNTIILQTGSIAFDASTMEIWGPLLNGGILCLEENEVILDSERLKQVIRKRKINVLFLTTTLFNQMILSDSLLFSTVEYVIVGGEKVTEKFIRMMSKEKENQNVKLVNGYGPTENTTFSTTYTMDWNDIPENIPIGRPISNSTAYVMNGMELCGIGVAGELCLGGDGLAIGYLNDDKLNNERFFDNPFGPGKLYRSGDLVKWNEDGNIEYIGRIDNQVKIRGFRIELKEIENILREIPKIKDACVIARTDSYHVKNLYAYFVADEKIDLMDVRRELQRFLPDYMIPARTMQIEKMPMNVNKKIDIKALPDIAENVVKDYTRPITETQKLIADVWKCELGIENIDMNEDFFQIGGDSLKAIRVLNHLKKTKTGLLLGDVLKYNTIFKLAEFIDCNLSKRDDKLISYNEVQIKESTETMDRSTEKILKELLTYYKEENDKLENQLLSGEMIAKYDTTAMQKYYIKENRISGEYFIYHGNASVEELKTAVIQLLNYYEAFHCVIDENLMVNQYEFKDVQDVPCYDLSVYNEDTVNKLLSPILKKIFGHNNNILGHLLFRILLIQLDKERVLLAFPFNHCMFDGASIDVLKRSFYMSIRKELPVFKEYRNKEYSERLMMGPKQVDEKQIIDKYDLQRFVQDSLRLDTQIHKKKLVGKQKSISMNIEVSECYIDKMQELSCSICVFLVGKLYEVSSIPIKLIGLGRRYEDQTYFDSLGLFIDYIPVRFDFTEGFNENIMDDVSERVNFAAAHNINFSTLAYEDIKDFDNISKLIGECLTKGGVVFNYQNQSVDAHFMSESEEIDQTVSTNNIIFIASAVENKLYLDIKLCHNMEREDICKIINDFVREL